MVVPGVQQKVPRSQAGSRSGVEAVQGSDSKMEGEARSTNRAEVAQEAETSCQAAGAAPRQGFQREAEASSKRRVWAAKETRFQAPMSRNPGEAVRAQDPTLVVAASSTSSAEAAWEATSCPKVAVQDQVPKREAGASSMTRAEAGA